jgi:excisionase family DNA binding protein
MNDNHEQPRPIMTVPQLAKYANCGSSTIYKIIDNGSLAAFALNPESPTRKNWRIYLKAWEAFVDAQATSRNGPLV